MEPKGAVDHVAFSTVGHGVTGLKQMAAFLGVFAVATPVILHFFHARPAGGGTILVPILGLAGLLAGIWLLLAVVTAAATGRGVADAEGLRYEPVLGRPRRLRWADLERLRWSAAGDFRGGGTRIVIAWQMLEPASRAALQAFLRHILADRYDLADAGVRPPRPPATPRDVLRSLGRVLALTVPCAALALAGYALALRGTRHGAWLVFAAGAIPYAFALREMRRATRSPTHPGRWRTPRPAAA